ncbi:MAG: hypothetical protein E7480_06850 [Ruminococcaceae bacterium]|nr:hypothetical protein [Oscillospiraceae bacterium]
MAIAFKVSDNFNLDQLIGKIAQNYQLHGYNVIPLSMGDNTCIEISKGKDSYVKYVGLSLCAELSMIKKGNILTISVKHKDWIFKMIAIALGILLSLGFVGVLLIAAGVFGIVKQYNFTQELQQNVSLILSNSASS